MEKIFAFRFRDKKGSKESLALFVSSDYSLDDVTKKIKEDIEKNLTPAKVFLIKPRTLQPETHNEKDKSFSVEFESFVGDVDEKLEIINFDGSGNFVTNSELRDKILASGALEIFKRRKGVISASSNYHFVKPSGDHCDKFIRAANLLTSGAEVSFLALSILPLLDENIRQIYIDTSSIANLLSTSLLMSGKFNSSYPTIDSFNSYDLFNQSLDFVENASSLIVISASTSGSMAKKIREKYNFEKSQVITLFHTGIPSDQVGLYDISSAINGGITSLKRDKCQWCDKGIPLIKIIDDQFLPETPRNESLIIKKSHFSSSKSRFFEEFAAQNILKWNTVPAKGLHVEHFFFDIEELIKIKSEYFKKLLLKFFNKYVSLNLRTVVTLDDNGSESLTKQLKNYLGKKQEDISWLKLSDLSEDEMKNGDNVMVVAGAITSGRKLLSASRSLRGINENATITYLVGVSKLPSQESLKQLKTDLCHGGNSFEALVECPLPRITESTKTAWDMEEDLLANYESDNPFLEDTLVLPKLLQDRLVKIRSGSLGPNEMFYPKLQGDKLSLRRTFAFWSDLNINEKSSSQADVYWTIQTLLLDLRSKPDNGDLSSVYHSTFIDPVCFDRFNDGVIQACILRAARFVELNYAADDDNSRKMTEILKSVVQEQQSAQGEAVFEFLLALCIGKLTLVHEHMEELVELASEVTTSNELRFFVNYLSTNFLKKK